MGKESDSKKEKGPSSSTSDESPEQASNFEKLPDEVLKHIAEQLKDTQDLANLRLSEKRMANVAGEVLEDREILPSQTVYIVVRGFNMEKYRGNSTDVPSHPYLIFDDLLARLRNRKPSSDQMPVFTTYQEAANHTAGWGNSHCIVEAQITKQNLDKEETEIIDPSKITRKHLTAVFTPQLTYNKDIIDNAYQIKKEINGQIYTVAIAYIPSPLEELDKKITASIKVHKGDITVLRSKPPSEFRGKKITILSDLTTRLQDIKTNIKKEVNSTDTVSETNVLLSQHVHQIHDSYNDALDKTKKARGGWGTMFYLLAKGASILGINIFENKAKENMELEQKRFVKPSSLG